MFLAVAVLVTVEGPLNLLSNRSKKILLCNWYRRSELTFVLELIPLCKIMNRTVSE
jgi:hypothetical protein